MEMNTSPGAEKEHNKPAIAVERLLGKALVSELQAVTFPAEYMYPYLLR